MDRKSVSEADITSVQSLILGADNEHIKKAVREDAHDIVTNVISEAAQVRQEKDGSVSRVLAPMLDSAISHGIEKNKSTFVNAMYPLVGSLVRKSVAVFFANFLEKLNYLIEYSLTIKGLKWRFEAWRQGIPFVQYILKKTFVYQVEDVLLIHRESGTLLLDVTSEHSACNDPALTSAMLTAINDFVADSFKQTDTGGIDSIKTHNFTLVISRAPQALLVAAVSGLPPAKLQSQLQEANESIQQEMGEQLADFSGDCEPFIQVEPLLKSCLLSEINPNVNKKKPTKALFAVALLFCFVSVVSFRWWQNQHVIDTLKNTAPPAGWHVQSVKNVGDNIQLSVMRDPAAQSIEGWLNELNLADQSIKIHETPFVSLSPKIVEKKVQYHIKESNADINYSLKDETITLIANDHVISDELRTRLLATPGISSVLPVKRAAINVIPTNQYNSVAQQVALLSKHIGNTTVLFDVKSAQLNANAADALNVVAQQLTQLNELSQQGSIKLGVIVSGYSDKTGNPMTNLTLSQQRADAVKAQLVLGGVPNEIIYAVGHGELPIDALADAARSVVISLISGNAP
ncbi:OmpA family protein [Thalassotalea euphylliae]|uniref:OmpA family protein n=1 Tax=Thalassotalea euphylliae TaxID=1655234 RepID=UPI00362A3FC5